MISGQIHHGYSPRTVMCEIHTLNHLQNPHFHLQNLHFQVQNLHFQMQNLHSHGIESTFSPDPLPLFPRLSRAFGAEAMAALEAAKVNSVQRVCSASAAKVAKLIRAVGFFNVKAELSSWGVQLENLVENMVEHLVENREKSGKGNLKFEFRF